MRLSRRAAISNAASAVIGLLATAGGARWARAAGDAPPLGKWLGEITERKGNFPFAITFVTALPAKGKGLPKFLDIDAQAFNAASYMRVADPANVNWEIKLNSATYESQDAAQVALQVARADTLVLAPPKGPWQFLQVSANGKRQVLKKAKAPKSTSVEDILAWLPTALNWDGVVLDQQGDFLLVGSSAKILATPQIQALAISNSEKKFAVAAAERKGSGLLSLSEVKAGVGVFDIVLLGQGVSAIAPGTKLIIEKKS